MALFMCLLLWKEVSTKSLATAQVDVFLLSKDKEEMNTHVSYLNLSLTYSSLFGLGWWTIILVPSTSTHFFFLSAFRTFQPFVSIEPDYGNPPCPFLPQQQYADSLDCSSHTIQSHLLFFSTPTIGVLFEYEILRVRSWRCSNNDRTVPSSHWG